MKTTLQKLRRLHRSGMALLVVMVAIVIATVMGTAILTSASMQTQVKGNIFAGAQADYLAESGVQLGIHYLQNPAAASGSLDAGGVYAGGTSITFGADMPGYVDIAVTNVAAKTYDITATAHGGNSLTREQTARVYVNSEFKQTAALSCAGDFTMPAFFSVNGDIRCDGNLTVTVGATLLGAVKAIASNYLPFDAPDEFPTIAVPAFSDINIATTVSAATPYYTYVDVDGTTKIGFPQQLPAMAMGTFTGAANNPKNVWYSNGNVMLVGFWLDGTIVMRGATNRLSIMDQSQINAKPGMPALVIEGAVKFSSDFDYKSLVIEGLAWVGKDFNTTGLLAGDCNIFITGALLMGPNAHGVNANYDGIIDVTYDAAKVGVPNFSSVGAMPKSVKILRWGN